MGNGNRPTPEFRREAVRLALTSGRTRREIAGDLGIGLSTLTRWLSQGRDVGEPSEAPVDLHAELKRLRRENTVLKQERDILKKSRGLLRERDKSMTFGFIEAERAIEAPSVRAQWRGPASRSAGCAASSASARAASSPGPGPCGLSPPAAGLGLSGAYQDDLHPVERHLRQPSDASRSRR